MREWQSIGPHRFRFEDDVLCFEPHGRLTPTEVERWLDVVGSHFEHQEQGFVMVDAREFRPPSAKIRRMVLSGLRERGINPRVVGFGINVVLRAASRIILAVARKLYGVQFDMMQFATEKQAWDYVKMVRRLRRPALAP